ncbi:MAG: nucleotidyltransferase family protein [Ruminococcaceae bacterium]|nr:nucleotidyltransferase family protein [Oscillospiraceae bacterium]
MKLMAVICEYNPFHNGHAYQLSTQKEALGCDAAICLMSGSFVQRGEPALLDKWARAEMAIHYGCDLVLELPALYSLQSAEGFARGAVSLLAGLGVEGYLAFGSECGNAAWLKTAAETAVSVEFQEVLKRHLSTGKSYPQACAETFRTMMPLNEKFEERPNDILGIEYIKAINFFRAKLSPAVICRRGAHDGTEPEHGFLSAGGIRTKVAEGQSIEAYMPSKAFQIYQREVARGRAPVNYHGLDSLLCYALMRTKREELAGISGVSEGLEKRLMDAGAACRTASEIAATAHTKRYPLARIQRVMMNVLLGISKDDETILPCYGRVLALGNRGGEVLRHLQKTSILPIITKTADYQPQSREAARLFAIDCIATDVYSLLYPNPVAGKTGMDFYRSPIQLRSALV